jgi:lipoyl(octanoyl) transferase
VFTAGKRTSPLDCPLGDAGAPVVEVDRGGKIARAAMSPTPV